jgi:hypothetical protein
MVLAAALIDNVFKLLWLWSGDLVMFENGDSEYVVGGACLAFLVSGFFET